MSNVSGDPAKFGPHPDNPQHQTDAPRRQIVRPAFRAVFQFARFMVTLPVVLIRGRVTM